jgi:predicted nuclease of restriction endonuclease-like (RecB) superfamily
MTKPTIPDYPSLFEEIKSRVTSAQTRVALAVNAKLVNLYWDIGRLIVQRQQAEGWGAKVIDRLARDLKAAFPAMRGFSASNLTYMRFFAEQCPDDQIGQQAADQLPWFHVVAVLRQLDNTDAADRTWHTWNAIALSPAMPT